MPVRATAEERKRFAFRALRLLQMPPRVRLAEIIFFLEVSSFTFINNQYQPNVSQLNNRVLKFG
jgi:hypothetical protein